LKWKGSTTETKHFYNFKKKKQNRLLRNSFQIYTAKLRELPIPGRRGAGLLSAVGSSASNVLALATSARDSSLSYQLFQG
jgi:hypothetical protein